MSGGTRPLPRRAFGFAVAACLVAWSWGCASAAGADTDVEAEIRAWLDGYSAAVAAGDWERVGGFYDDDPEFLVLEDGRVRYRSAEEVRASLRSMVAAFQDVSTSFAGVDVLALGPDRAHVATIVHQRFVGERGAVEFEAALSLLLVRTDTGWKILRAHTSTRGAGG